MSSEPTPAPQAQSSSMFGIFNPAMDYAIDAAQSTILFWDVMRQRGNQYREHLAETVPHVLSYDCELIIDGRTLKRPVNYGLVRIIPPAGVTIDPQRRPFVIVDPRAGHGPALAGSRPTARSAWRSKQVIRAISLASCPSQCPARPSKILRVPKRCSWRR